MIVSTLVFVLTLQTSHGDITTISDIATWRDCERLRIRTEANPDPRVYDRVHGVCTQVPKIFVVADTVQANVKVTPPAVTVTPAPVVIQPVNVTIKKD